MSSNKIQRINKGNKRKALVVTLLFHLMVFGGFIYADGNLANSNETAKETTKSTKKKKKTHIPSLSDRINKRLAKAKKALN